MSTLAHKPECPRCGYDLDGQIAAWHPAGADADNAACPAAGTCPECGLDFEWRYVLVEGLAAPVWFFETARVRHVRRAIRTWLRSLNPRTFWRDVRLEVAPRLWRLFWYVVISLIVLSLAHPAVAIISRAWWYFANATGAARFSGKRFATPWGELDLACRDFMQNAPFYVGAIKHLLWPAIAVAMIFMPPFVLMCLPWTRARSKVRFAHVVRAAVYAIAPVIALLTWSWLIGLLVAIYQQVSSNPWNSPWFGILDPFTPTGTYGFGFTMPFHWACLAWYLLYWWCVLTNGWRMDDYRKVYVAIIVPSLLLGFILLLLSPGFLLRLT